MKVYREFIYDSSQNPHLKLIVQANVCTAGNIINGYMTIFHMNRVLFFEQKGDWSSLTAAVMAYA